VQEQRLGRLDRPLERRDTRRPSRGPRQAEMVT
jgi:hypothetical protein